MIRILLTVIALIAPFLFPYPFTLVLSFAGALAFPVVGLLVGALVDLLYYVPHPGIYPLATFTGVFIFVAAFFVRRFVKARIIGG